MELSQTDLGALKASGRSFNCDGCAERVKKLRRCGEDRFDFNENDGSIWPMQIEKGGEMFGFCPGKATWDAKAVQTFQLLTLAAETGEIKLIDGGMMDQPDWWLDNLAWFVPRYNLLQFISRAKMILGDGKKGVTGGGIKR